MTKQIKDLQGISKARAKRIKATSTKNVISKLPDAEKSIMMAELDKKLSQTIIKSSGKYKSEVEALISANPILIKGNQDKSVHEIFDKHLAKASGMTEDKVADLRKTLGSIGDATVGSITQLDTPIKEHPVLGKEHRKKINSEIGSMIGLNTSKLKKYVVKDLRYDELGSIEINKLIDEKIINKRQAKKLDLVSNLSRLTGDNTGFIKELTNDGIVSVTELVDWTKGDWSNYIKNKGISLPDGVTARGGYAQDIYDNIKSTFPTKFLMNRLTKVNIQEISDKIEAGGSGDMLVQSFANQFKGMGIAACLADKKMDAVEKSKAVKETYEAFVKFGDNNPGLSIRMHDFMSAKNQFNWKGIKDEHKAPIRKQYMSLQRVERLAKDPERSEILLSKGFGSSKDIAELTEAQFVGQSGLDYEHSIRTYKTAVETMAVVGHYHESLRSVMMTSFMFPWLPEKENIINGLKDIDGFEDYFGSHDYCDCDHCRSILSPAAYFVDLMYFIEKNVSKKYFSGNKADHPLHLKVRREDLWDLTLTCKHTNELIPYLQIVNEILEKFLKVTEVGVTEPYHYIYKASHSWHHPVNVPLMEMRAYLSHFELTSYDLFKLMGRPRDLVRRERLKMSERDVFILKSNYSTNRERVYKFLEIKNINRYEVKDFLESTGLKRDELSDWFKVEFSTEIKRLSKQLAKRDPSDLQQNVEYFKNLTKTRLDLLYRYEMLRRHTPWSVREFDLVVSALENTTSKLIKQGHQNFLILADALIIQDTLGLNVEELTAVLGLIPLVPKEVDGQNLIQRTFNLETLYSNKDLTASDSFVIPADKQVDHKTPAVLAGLNISEAEFLVLCDMHSLDLTADLTITISILSDLYRATRIARGLAWDIYQYQSACSLVLNNVPAKGLNNIHLLISLKEWIDEFSLSIDSVHFIISGQESNQITFKVNREELVSFLAKEKQTDLQSKREKLIVHLAAKFSITKEELEAVYAEYLLSYKFADSEIDQALNAQFDTNDVPLDSTKFDNLFKVVIEIQRYHLLFDKLDFSSSSISYIVNNADAFDISDIKSLTLENVKTLGQFSTLEDQIEKEKIEQYHGHLIQTKSSNSYSADFITFLSANWEIPSGIINSYITTTISANILIERQYNFMKKIKACQKLGLTKQSLDNLTRLEDYGKTRTARDIILGSFQSKYPNEETREEILEPYKNKINEIRRDALCDAIIGKKEKYKFKDRTDLYSFFLLDVDMGGCFKTSKVVCANSSLQLYVHRCLLNLEKSRENLSLDGFSQIDISPSDIPKEEWDWRKYYRVWEANRKIYLYPENYIDPVLRDTKTHIFKELEDELLQKEITKESAEDAYKKYLTQFVELTKLRYAGAYYHQAPHEPAFANVDGSTIFIPGTIFNSESSESKYYLFARTNTNPYQYYYRTYSNYYRSWSNWIKMDVAIEAEEISAIMFNGRLYILWTHVVSKEISKLQGGASERSGYQFKIYAKYCHKKEDNSWTTPQEVYVGQTYQNEESIFERVDLHDIYEESEDARDKILDVVIQDYKSRVFKKPYPFRNSGNKSIPIRLQYIWSQNHNVLARSYRTSSSQKTLFRVFNSPIILEIPSVSFDSYPSTKTIQATIKVRLLNDTYSYDDTEIEVTLTNPDLCTFSGEDKTKLEGWGEFGWKKTGPLSVTSSTEVQKVEYSDFDLSLSRNLISDAKLTELVSWPIHENSAIYQEYQTSILNENVFSHKVEDGTSNFASKGRSIYQGIEGSAKLDIDSYNLFTRSMETNTVILSTIETNDLLDIFYSEGLETFISYDTQNTINEFGENLDIKGPYGEYYWELFLHTPYTIANHLNANQKYEKAKWWYERIFNPTTSASQVQSTEFEHVWIFKPFRENSLESLKDILTDSNAIKAYNEDPFDPHAIARNRMQAYQKAIFMSYVDNLIDWGDSLFAQDTRETITEAIQHYKLAADLLGRKPIKLGKCEIADENQLKYEALKDRICQGSELLITLENSYYIIQQNQYSFYNTVQTGKYLNNLVASNNHQVKFNPSLEYASNMARQKGVIDITDMQSAASMSPTSSGISAISVNRGTALTVTTDKRVKKYDEQLKGSKYEQPYPLKKVWADASIIDYSKLSKVKPILPPRLELVKESVLAFCVPDNKDLKDYWDRVEDRLYKIHNCMNISGVVRDLALFSPPIDPNLLVRATAMGLSLEDILTSQGQVGHYRFTYLIEKARQFASTVQGFGNALLSALEKKDAEELTLLRSVHEQNILKITERIKKHNIDEAKNQVDIAKSSLKNVENRLEHYEELIDEGLLPWEITQQVSRHLSGTFKAIEGAMHLTQGITYLLPQLGSPFSMKYGGKELGDSADGFADWLRSMASVADSVASSAGLEAGNQRREQDWKHQLKLAKQEMKTSEKQLLLAEVRLAITEKDLEIHQSSIDQAKELHDFYKEKFTDISLYNYMASTLTRLYREAYNLAKKLADQAQQSYKFEAFRDDIFIEGNNWDSSKAGLLAADSLMLQLQQLENAYLEHNPRIPEISQTFSLALIDPIKIRELRQTGTCNFTIPELAFELSYPGQYRRMIKSVRMSIPAVVGPYTNVSAKLTLVQSEIELQDDGVLSTRQFGDGTSISASSAQNDAGMFEFNFRDERYLPFEGAGAINSEWQLDLPSKIRSFDYDSISDVLITMNYTALDGDRASAETDIVNTLSANELSRIVSLKYEFPNSWHQLFASNSSSQQTSLSIEESHFPYFAKNGSLDMKSAIVFLKPKDGQSMLGSPALSIKGTSVTWVPGQDLQHATNPTNTSKKDKLKAGSLNITGTPVGEWLIDAGAGELTQDDLDDIIILIKYKI